MGIKQSCVETFFNFVSLAHDVTFSVSGYISISVSNVGIEKSF